jgi:hypothetical protein
LHLTAATIAGDPSRQTAVEIFFRGCGLVDHDIDYFRSLIGSPVQFYSAFISHSTANAEFASRLHERMRAENLRVWYAPEDMKGGRLLRDQINQAIRIHDKLVLVLSEASMPSNWVAHEIIEARKAERASGAQKLFPIRLADFEAVRAWELPDDDTGEDLARYVRRYHILDFTKWKDHDAFEAAFVRLLRDLQHEGIELTVTEGCGSD